MNQLYKSMSNRDDGDGGGGGGGGRLEERELLGGKRSRRIYVWLERANLSEPDIMSQR